MRNNGDELKPRGNRIHIGARDTGYRITRKKKSRYNNNIITIIIVFVLNLLRGLTHGNLPKPTPSHSTRTVRDQIVSIVSIRIIMRTEIAQVDDDNHARRKPHRCCLQLGEFQRSDFLRVCFFATV